MRLAISLTEDLLKAKAVPPGTRSVHGGVPKIKVGKKWVRVAEGKTLRRQKMDVERSAQGYFDYAMTTNLGEVVERVLMQRGIDSFESLVDTIKKNDDSEAHRIYKDVVDAVRAEQAPTGDKKAVLDLFGRSLISLRNQYATKPKTRVTVKIRSKKGTEYVGYAEGKHTSELPALKPTVLQAAKKKMGGWSVTGTLSTEHVKKMLSQKSAKLVSGKIDARRPWHLPSKASDMDLKYKGRDLTVTVTQQRKPRGAKRAKVTARVDIKIPYAYAKAFLANQIKSVRTRNDFIFRLEHSQGYRDYVEEKSA